MSEPTGNIGWFPRYSPANSRYTWERVNYWQAQWFDGVTEIAHNGVQVVIGGVPQVGTLAPNELSAGANRWAGFRPDPVRVYTSWLPDPILGAGCPTVNPDGLFGYVDNRQSSVKNLFFDNRIVSRGAITDVRASRQALVWSDGGRTWGLRLDSPDAAADIQAAPAEFRPIPIDTPFGPWVLNHTHTGIIVRPFGETTGYRFDNGGQTFYPDARYANGIIVAIFTNESGAQFTQSFDLQAPRVNLGVIAQPPIDFPPTFPQEPPMADLNLHAQVSSERAKYPMVLAANDTATIMNTVAWNENQRIGSDDWGLSVKPNGSHVLSPGGVFVAYDILHNRRAILPGNPFGTLFGCFTAVDGVTVVNWGEELYHGDPAGRPWLSPVRPGGVAVPPMEPPPSTDLTARVEALETEVAVLRSLVLTIHSDLAALEVRVEAIQPIDIAAAVALALQGYEVNGSTGRTALHTHSVRLSLTRKP